MEIPSRSCAGPVLGSGQERYLAISDTGRALSHHISLSTVPLGAKRGGAQLGRVSFQAAAAAWHCNAISLPLGGTGTLFCILTPCASASRFEDKLRQSPRVIHPGIQLWTRWVR